MKRPKPRRMDGELLWTFSLSLAAHAVLMFLFLAGPNRYLNAAPPPLESYTVELIAPGVVGGDGGPVGPLGDAPAADLGTGGDEAVAEPEPAVEEEVVAEPEPVVEEEVVAEPEPVVEEEVVAEPEPVVEEEVVAEPEPVVEEEVVAEPEPAVEEEVPPAPEVVVGESPEDEASADKPDPVEVAKRAPTKPAAATPKPTKKVATKPKSSGRKATPDPVAERDRRIAEAIGRRATQPGAESIDDRIAAAVRRRAEGMAAGGGGSGGPLSSGPGGAPGGGTVIGAEYVLYKRRMEVRIRDAWVWAGLDDSLEAVVRFAIAPEGRVENVRTTRPSGDKAFDASVERAVEAASPLGMVPEKYRREFADIEMTFRAKDLRR